MACTSRSRNGSACDYGPTLMSHRSSASWKSCPLPRVRPCSVTSSRTCFHEQTNVKTARPCQAHKQKNASVFRQRKRTMCTLLTELYFLGYSRGCCAQRPRDRKPQRLALRRPEWSSDVVTTAVNVVPALLGGVLVYGLTALWLRRGRSAIVQLAYARGVRDYRGPVSRLDSVGRNLAMGE